MPLCRLSSETRPPAERAANLDLRLDSIYTRSVGISGKPLRDGFHFGQTIVNDYGRPYGEGFNQVTGLSASAVAGVFRFPSVVSISTLRQCLPIHSACCKPPPRRTTSPSPFRRIPTSTGFV